MYAIRSYYAAKLGAFMAPVLPTAFLPEIEQGFKLFRHLRGGEIVVKLRIVREAHGPGFFGHHHDHRVGFFGKPQGRPMAGSEGLVITSYSIHYTKLYDIPRY